MYYPVFTDMDGDPVGINPTQVIMVAKAHMEPDRQAPYTIIFCKGGKSAGVKEDVRTVVASLQKAYPKAYPTTI